MTKPKKHAHIDIDDSQGELARKGFGDLSAAFARSSHPMGESPVKEKMAKIRKMIDDKDQHPDATSSSGGMERSILDAIGALSTKMDGMALKTDLQEMKSEIGKEIKVTVAEAVDPLKSELHELKCELQEVKGRVSILEQPGTSSTDAQPATSPSSVALKKANAIINQLDPAKKQVALVGFPDNDDANARIKRIEEFMRVSFPQERFAAVDNYYAGPYGNRKLTKAAYVEFWSIDSATAFLNTVKGSRSSKLSIRGADITVKAARPKIGGKRHYSLRKAEELVKSHETAKNKEIKIIWKDRIVEVDGIAVFTQGKDEIGGSFLPPYADLRLP